MTIYLQISCYIRQLLYSRTLSKQFLFLPQTYISSLNSSVLLITCSYLFIGFPICLYLDALPPFLGLCLPVIGMSNPIVSAVLLNKILCLFSARICSWRCVSYSTTEITSFCYRLTHRCLTSDSSYALCSIRCSAEVKTWDF